MYNKKLNTHELFDSISNYFSPKIIGEVNEAFIKLAKVKGPDVPWHTHDHEDELFYIIKGHLTMELKGQRAEHLSAGDLFIVEKGAEHRVFSDDECWLMLVENQSTRHTGNTKSNITKSVSKQRY